MDDDDISCRMGGRWPSRPSRQFYISAVELILIVIRIGLPFERFTKKRTKKHYAAIKRACRCARAETPKLLDPEL